MDYQQLTCGKHGYTLYKHEKNGTGYRWRCVKCSTEYRRNGRRKSKEILVKEYGGKCVRCGYNKCVAALQFHHLDPTTKEFGIGVTQVSTSLDRKRKEAEKCELICANCHAEQHWA